MAIRLLAIPFSTNVERVTLALAHKGLEAELVLLEAGDRSPAVELSGQALVPVLDDEGMVIADSTAILEYLEARFPEPPLYPRETSRRAEAEVFIDWFDRVWKGPPNAIAAELSASRPDQGIIAAAARALRVRLELFEALLADRDHLLGEEFSVADVVAYPFLRYGVHAPAHGDHEVFHAVLHEHLRLEPRHAHLRRWIAAVEGRPR